MLATMMQPSDREAFTREEIAAKFGMSEKTWWRLVRAGRAQNLTSCSAQNSTVGRERA